MFKRILMVCIGNICRSPTAEYLLRRACTSSELEIGSAGLRAMVDRPMEKNAAQVLQEHGGDGSPHKGRQATAELLRAQDLILVMEKSHAAAIHRMVPEVTGKVFLLGKWSGDTEIPDPYGQQRPAFDHVYTLIEQGVSAWLPYLQRS